MLAWILFSVVTLFLLVSLYVNFTLYRKVVFYEEWYESFAKSVENVLRTLQQMDALGAMQTDDEVGYFFQALKSLMVDLFEMGFYDAERINQIREDLDVPREEG
jgi:hypothetical protein